MIACSGNRGETIRSDCYAELEILPEPGISVQLKSKVRSLYGNSIDELCRQVLSFFGIQGARLFLDDSGALPFVIAARIEAAVKQLAKTEKSYLFPILPQNRYQTSRTQNRRTRLYLPGNNPKLMINAGIYGSDAIILDLEDSVSPEKKSEARFLVRNALCQADFYGAERMVRINPFPEGMDDLPFIVPFNVNTILIPKCENAGQVVQVEKEIEKIAGTRGYGIFLMPIIETALGIENAYSIASASSNVVALAIGLEDYTADLGTRRTPEGDESWYARCRLVNAAVAAGVQPIDSVFSEFEDLEALSENARKSKTLGFVGMGCIHPAQVKIINEMFIPGPDEIEKAQKIAVAFEKAHAEGKAVVAVGTKMVDPPVVKRALKTIENAILFGQLDQNWRENFNG